MSMEILAAVIVLGAVGAAFLILRPYVPAWFWFAIYVGAALYFFADLVLEGPELQNIVILAVSASAALVTWWHDLRGTRDRRPGSPDEP